MKLRWFIFFGLLFIVLAAVATAPASLLDQQLRKAGSAHLALEGAEGTLWRGRGRLVALLPDGPLTLIDRLQWQMDYSALFGGAIAYRFGTEETAEAARLRLTPHAIALDAVHLRLPAAVLALIPELATSQTLGELTIDLPHLDWNVGSSNGQGQMIWDHARVIAPDGNARDLARPAFELRAEGNRVAIKSAPGSALKAEIELARSDTGSMEWRAKLNP